MIDGDSVYWSENQPEANARRTILRWTDAGVEDVLPASFSARSRVHEEGGGEYWIADGIVYFVNDSDQRLYRLRPGEEPVPLTESGPLRYADGVVDQRHDRVIAIREDHRSTDGKVRNAVVAVELDSPHEVTVLASQCDFYAAPRLSPDGTRLAYLCWDHPHMPWDSTELWVSDVTESGVVQRPVRVAGGPSESIFQPEWSPDGKLYFVSDRTGWWNLYRLGKDPTTGGYSVKAITAREAEFGRAMWNLGMATYGFASSREIVASYIEHGQFRLSRIDTETLEMTRLDLPFSYYYAIAASGGTTAFIGASATVGESLIVLTGEDRIVRVKPEQTGDRLATRYISTPEPITFGTGDGTRAHALFYRPHNPDFQAPPGSKPPLIVVGHGGPTYMSPMTRRTDLQYWTSRGFAVLDVNYRGSEGYGRSYRNSLYGNWGVYDVEDCVNGARYLVRQGLVDGARMVMRGSSAGGLSTLNALTFHDVFQTGAVYYGVSDLALLLRSTHKFESRYLEQLIGPYPEMAEVYRTRSALFHTDELDVPVIFFHGAKDAIVPIEQTELMVERLRARGIETEFLRFPDEYHGFRRADTLVRSLQEELAFYRRILAIPVDEGRKPARSPGKK